MVPWRTQCSVLAFISASFKAILGSKKCKNCNGFCTGHLVCLEKVLAIDSNDLPAAQTYLPINDKGKLCESSKGEPRLINSEDEEELAK